MSFRQVRQVQGLNKNYEDCSGPELMHKVWLKITSTYIKRKNSLTPEKMLYFRNLFSALDFVFFCSFLYGENFIPKIKVLNPYNKFVLIVKWSRAVLIYFG